MNTKEVEKESLKETKTKENDSKCKKPPVLNEDTIKISASEPENPKKKSHSQNHTAAEKSPVKDVKTTKANETNTKANETNTKGNETMTKVNETITKQKENLKAAKTKENDSKKPPVPNENQKKTHHSHTDKEKTPVKQCVKTTKPTETSTKQKVAVKRPTPDKAAHQSKAKSPASSVKSPRSKRNKSQSNDKKSMPSRKIPTRSSLYTRITRSKK